MFNVSESGTVSYLWLRETFKRFSGGRKPLEFAGFGPVTYI
jgi:hypothetical protein